MTEVADRVPEWFPEKIRTFSGDTFCPRENIWSFRTEGATFSFNFDLAPVVARPMVAAWKRTLIWYLQNKSAHHAKGAFERVLHLVRFLSPGAVGAIPEITPTDILNYRSSLPPKRQWYLASLSGVLCRWSDLGYSGVPAETSRLLRSLRLPGNDKGEAVRTSDPFEGPLTDIEFSGLMTALDDGLATGMISEENFLLLWLTACLGLRPLQVSQLKIGDLHPPRLTGASQWLLDIPRLKQPGTIARTQVRTRPIISTVGAMLQRQATRVRCRFDTQSEDLPLFPAVRDTRWLAGYEWHQTAKLISHRIKSVAERLCVFSERTGELLSISSRRLRRSFGTRAAGEGMGEYEVADLLDHSDTQNAQVYVEATSDIMERLDKAIALKLAPLAQAFSGHFASTEELRKAPGGVVRGGVQAPPLGACGQQAFCGFAAPIACYTCRQFRAWRDGPHEAVLERLILERDRLQATTDPRIAAVNDRTILAVAEVVRLCAEADGDG